MMYMKQIFLTSILSKIYLKLKLERFTSISNSLSWSFIPEPLFSNMNKFVIRFKPLYQELLYWYFPVADYSWFLKVLYQS